MEWMYVLYTICFILVNVIILVFGKRCDQDIARMLELHLLKGKVYFVLLASLGLICFIDLCI